MIEILLCYNVLYELSLEDLKDDLDNLMGKQYTTCCMVLQGDHDFEDEKWLVIFTGTTEPTQEQLKQFIHY